MASNLAYAAQTISIPLPDRPSKPSLAKAEKSIAFGDTRQERCQFYQQQQQALKSAQNLSPDFLKRQLQRNQLEINTYCDNL